MRMAGMTINSAADSGANTTEGRGNIEEAMNEAQRSVQKALDCQAFIISLFSKGSPPAAV